MSYSVNISVTEGTIDGADISIITLGELELDATLELDFDVSDELLDEAIDAWLEVVELTGAVELMVGLELLFSLLLATMLSDEDVCGLVLVLLAVNPLPLPPALPPPPHALKSEIIVAATRVVILGKLKLLIGLLPTAWRGYRLSGSERF